MSLLITTLEFGSPSILSGPFAKIETFGKTGAEIEAIHGVSTGLITIYDMCKSVDRSMIINKIRLDFKEGGKSGKWER